MVGIGFFAPFPLALMIPFMAGQSLAMGEAFGKGFQYGKRKISSMSNEEFNALNFQQLSESIATDYKVMIPSIQKSIQASQELQRTVLQEMGQLIKTIPSEILNFFGSLVGQTDNTTTNTSGITNVRLNRNQDIQADRDRIASDLRDAEQKILEFTHGVLTAETLSEAKRRADLLAKQKAKQDKIDADVIETKSPVPGGQSQFIITNPSKATGTATGIFRTSNIVKKRPKPRAPRSILTQYGKYMEEARAAFFIWNRRRKGNDTISLNWKKIERTALNNARALFTRYDMGTIKFNISYK